MEQQNSQLPQNNVPKPPSNKFLWFAFFFAIFIYNIVAILIAQTPDESRIKTFAPKLAGSDIGRSIRDQDKFMGFVGMDIGTYTLLFYAFLAISAINFIVIFKFRSKANVGRQAQQEFGKEFNFGVLRIVFAESIAIFGLLLFLLNGNFSHLILFTALAIIGMLLVYPRN